MKIIMNIADDKRMEYLQTKYKSQEIISFLGKKFLITNVHICMQYSKYSVVEIVLDEIINHTKEVKGMMLYDPTTGEPKPYPSQADQYREYHGKVAWLFNPYTGDSRDARDIGSDTFGYLIVEE